MLTNCLHSFALISNLNHKLFFLFSIYMCFNQPTYKCAYAPSRLLMQLQQEDEEVQEVGNEKVDKQEEERERRREEG